MRHLSQRVAALGVMILLLAACRDDAQISGIPPELRSVYDAVTPLSGTDAVRVDMQNDRDLRVRIINSPLGALTVADKPTRALEIARRAYEEYRSRSALRTVDVTFVIEGRRLFVLPYEDGRDSFRFMTKDLDPEPPILREGWVRPATPEKDLYFIAIGDVPPALMTAMVGHFERKFGISITLLAPLSRDRATFDFSRSQLIADELIAAVRFRYATLARNPRTRVIGITADDMYMRATQATWR